MSLPDELAQIFRRDITRLLQEVEAFSDQETLWRRVPGIGNSAGNLMLHLEGNLREYIGRQLGAIPYNRQRDLEFTSSDLPADDLIERLEVLKELIPRVVSGLSGMQLESEYPEKVFGSQISTQQLLFSLLGHLNYHLGQIDYLRRILTEGTALEFAGL
jgi:hypothetical protein